ncbi:hypothetical protein [Clavibacter tessellarius]|uniref:hypothetical protein n=1 Tax=Clavibacter tessellarius TaxID=31965 RepID=UPI00324CC5BE
MFSADAEVPEVWESPKSGQEGRLLDAEGAPVAHDEVEAKIPRATGTCCSSAVRAPGSRSLLEERLAVLRARRGQHHIGA